MTLDDLGNLGELIAAIATVVTLIYLSVQIRTSNRLAVAEASRAPNSDLNTINAALWSNPSAVVAFRKVLSGAGQEDFDEAERGVMDLYLTSATNIQEQLAREIKAGILDPSALHDFGGTGIFQLPYYKDSWPLYRRFLSPGLVEEFEARYNLDPNKEYVL